MPEQNQANDNRLNPLHVFRFQVDFVHDPFPGIEQQGDTNLCSGAFAECSGLEATMEPKVIKEGGRNYGAAQRAGPVTFSTVVLKRGITSTRHLWQWFELLSSKGKYSFRLAARIQLFPPGHVFGAESDETEGQQAASKEPVWTWRLAKAMPVKFKVPDLNATGSEIGIEELHLAHEGISLETGAKS